MAHDIRQAIAETATARPAHPPAMLESGGLAAALRAAAVSVAHAFLDVASAGGYPPEIAFTVYLCWLDALERADGDDTIAVRADEGSLTFDVVGKPAI